MAATCPKHKNKKKQKKNLENTGKKKNTAGYYIIASLSIARTPPVPNVGSFHILISRLSFQK